MTKVRVLVDAVGEFNAGDIVNDALAGLVEIAEKGTRNAATGALIAEIVKDETAAGGGSDESEELKDLRVKARGLKIKGADKLSEAELVTAIDEAEALIAKEQELKDLKAKAKEFKVDGYGKMTEDELKVAIAAAGGGSDAQ
jgi:hypothetical protein